MVFATLLGLAAIAQAAEALEVAPASLRLVGSDAMAQLVVARGTGTSTRDATALVRYMSRDPKVAVVEPSGLVRAAGDGQTTIVVSDDAGTREIAVEVVDFADARPVSFVSKIEPILSRYGCNAGACHGKATGQNGFRLSLLGFDPPFDYDALVREGRGRRVIPGSPERSLILQKPTAGVPHGGGRRFEAGSPEARTIARWIHGGLKLDVPNEPVLARIEVYPPQRLLPQRAAQQLRVTATFSDGTVEDVTRLAQYQSNAADLATVDGHGRVEALEGVGEASIMVRYGGMVTVARATIPRPGAAAQWPSPGEHLVDRLIDAKLRDLNLPPSPPCTDAEFARRSSLDIRGTLPSPEEVAAFEGDSANDKRRRWIDKLLNTPEYADYFAMKWSAILRNARGNEFFPNANKPTTFAFHTWVRQAIAQNMPYDKFAAALVAAKGDPAHNPAVAWYRTRDFNAENTGEGTAEDTAQLFLGMRIQCAKCHHHPFERWSQDDYYGFASFFSRIGRKPSDDPFAPRIFVLASGKARKPGKDTEYDPKALGGPEFKDLGPRDDPRERLAEWLSRPDNPYFARALVNRYWKHFLGRGLVEPEDDMRVTNPPANPELLDALAQSFVQSGYDTKVLIRLIATSDAYARSSLPTEENAADRQNFARFYPRRLPAEVLLDAIDRVTDTHEEYSGLPANYRAVQLPDEGYASSFLEVFGRPLRTSVCECERSSEPSLAQRLQLLNSDELEAKVRGRRAEELAKAAESRPEADTENVTLLYRLCFGRLPDAEERSACLGRLTRARAHGALNEGYEDLIWALVNTNEFLFNR